jgi:thermitase
MKKLFPTTILFFSLPALAALEVKKPQQDRVPGEFVAAVAQSEIQSFSAVTQALRNKGIEVQERISAKDNILRLRYTDSSLSLLELVSRLKGLISGARLVEPNYLYHALRGSPPPGNGNPLPPPNDGLPTLIPNDTNFGFLWGMRNIGQRDAASGGTAGISNADSSAAKAWKIRTDGSRVIVAVIDSGVDYNHPDLRDNMWEGRGPNGQLIHGYNAINNTFNPMDDNGHGTHCAGTIGGVGNNSRGVAGVAHRASIMAIKFLSSSGSGALSDAIKGIDFARENGAQIMSNSWGGGPSSSLMQEAIVRARNAGIVFIAAAGNEGNNNDTRASFPANYPIDNVISVAASNNRDQMASFSNYGKRMVHLMAPGEQIYSTIPGNKYDWFSGTSMATPHVSGAVALLLSQEPGLSPAAVRSRLMKSSDKISQYAQRLAAGRLNVYKLLRNEEGSSR